MQYELCLPQTPTVLCSLEAGHGLHSHNEGCCYNVLVTVVSGVCLFAHVCLCVYRRFHKSQRKSRQKQERKKLEGLAASDPEAYQNWVHNAEKQRIQVAITLSVRYEADDLSLAERSGTKRECDLTVIISIQLISKAMFSVAIFESLFWPRELKAGRQAV